MNHDVEGPISQCIVFIRNPETEEASVKLFNPGLCEGSGLYVFHENSVDVVLSKG